MIKELLVLVTSVCKIDTRAPVEDGLVLCLNQEILNCSLVGQ